MGNYSEKSLALGVDLGGTKISIRLADLEGRLVARTSQRTQAHRGLEGVLDNLEEGVRVILGEVLAPYGLTCKGIKESLEVLKQHGREVIGLGLGVAGVLSQKRDVLHEAPNLGWREVPLKKMVMERTGLEVWMENDTNIAALGEYWFGAGCKYSPRDPMIYIGVGTGIGGGIIIDGKLYRGYSGGAGELGHMVIDPQGVPCGSGHPGCLEALASGKAIDQMARDTVKQGRGETLLQLAEGDLEKVTGRVVARALAQGDITAQNIVQQVGAYLGMGIATIINLFNPALIVLGGGVALRLYEPLLEAARPEIELRAFSSLRDAVQIVPAGLGGDSAVLGAVALARSMALK